MNCKEFLDFLMRYLDHELPEGQGEVFEEHMRLCPACQDYLDTYRETIQLGKAACCDEDGSLPGDVPEKLIQAILAARSQG